MSCTNPAIKRIRADLRELSHHATDQYDALPIEDNLFEWHFTIRGPSETEYSGGYYHGRISLPPEYPFKPPDIMIYTPNGRFKTKTKICLSISGYHPEEWQPAWGIRTILEALISFFPTDGNGAVGSIDYSIEERKKLAKESLHYECSKCGKNFLKVFQLTAEERKTRMKSLSPLKQQNNYVQGTKEKEQSKEESSWFMYIAIVGVVLFLVLYYLSA